MNAIQSRRTFARGFFLVALLALAALLPQGCSRLGSSEPPHLIGHLAPRSGPDQASGVRLGEAVAMVVEETNHDDGNRVENKLLRVVHADTGPELDGFGSQATRLLAVDHVEALIGATNTAQLAKCVTPAQTTAIVIVSPSGALTGTPSKLIWAVGLHPTERGKWLARHAAEQMKITEVVTVTGQSNPTFPAIRGAFEVEFRHADRHIGSEWSFSEAKDFSKLAEKVAATNPKSILFCGKAADLLQLRGSLRVAKVSDSVPILFGGEEEESALRQEPNLSIGIVFVSAFTNQDPSEKVQKFCTDFRNRCGQLPDADAALSADAARVLFAAGRKAQTFHVQKTGPSLEKELEKLEIELPTGLFWFAKDAAARRKAYVLRMEAGEAKLQKSYEPEKK